MLFVINTVKMLQKMRASMTPLQRRSHLSVLVQWFKSYLWEIMFLGWHLARHWDSRASMFSIHIHSSYVNNVILYRFHMSSYNVSSVITITPKYVFFNYLITSWILFLDIQGKVSSL
jgi:hypothetical protein